MHLTDDHLRALTQALKHTRDHELTCDEYLERVAAYAERVAANAHVPETFALIVDHQRLCARCAEETQALVDLLRAQ
jgi:hypothetical protein